MLKGQRRDVRSSSCHFIKIDGGRKKVGLRDGGQALVKVTTLERNCGKPRKGRKRGWKAA